MPLLLVEWKAGGCSISDTRALKSEQCYEHAQWAVQCKKNICYSVKLRKKKSFSGARNESFSACSSLARKAVIFLLSCITSLCLGEKPARESQLLCQPQSPEPTKWEGKKKLAKIKFKWNEKEIVKNFKQALTRAIVEWRKKYLCFFVWFRKTLAERWSR